MEYRTVFEQSEAWHTDKRSEFIGRVAHASSEVEALAFVSRIKTLERDARHNVFAFIVSGGSVMRCSDDGEPQGTGGAPCLEVLKNSGLRDVVLTVTRYFGGVLLGAPGLLRAYNKAAADAVAAAKLVTMAECRMVTARYDYSFHGKISRLAEELSIVDNVEFSDTVKLKCFVRNEKTGRFASSVREITSGGADIEVSDESVYKAV